MTIGDGESQPETAEEIGALFGETEETPEGQEEQEGQDGQESEEQEETEEGEQERQEEPTFTVKHDGKEVTLKQSELIELGQKGFDYTKKTMALSDERKAVETEREQVNAEREAVTKQKQQTVDDLRVVNQFLASIMPQAPDISLAQQDASRYLAEKNQYDSLRDKLSQAQQALGIATQELTAEKQRQNAEKQAKTEKHLIDTLPGWKDAPAQKFGEATQYLSTLGLSGKNVGETALEPGFWIMAHKAQEYDKLMQKKAELKPSTPTRVATPGAANPVNPAKQTHANKMERFKKAPSLESLGDLI